MHHGAAVIGALQPIVDSLKLTEDLSKGSLYACFAHRPCPSIAFTASTSATLPRPQSPRLRRSIAQSREASDGPRARSGSVTTGAHGVFRLSGIGARSGRSTADLVETVAQPPANKGTHNTSIAAGFRIGLLLF